MRPSFVVIRIHAVFGRTSPPAVRSSTRAVNAHAAEHHGAIGSPRKDSHSAARPALGRGAHGRGHPHLRPVATRRVCRSHGHPTLVLVHRLPGPGRVRHIGHRALGKSCPCRDALRFDQLWCSQQVRPITVWSVKTKHSDHRLVAGDFQLPAARPASVRD
jgi:hypothetical protein